ncbi:SDR family oxidoreductase [Dactylosporangium fulvum]|uniref:SDR family oxidoreductase n=1 Tax=Dactylosporangium fulvum TaxID=53359 RepID=A0ABY5W6U1_9ACTN|nr:SDR family oxidoreductase [Dactylosporangium fulvum]UWP84979.1 SDR family oxidoreductase [Dactylosporangium fulvum]
MTVALVTGGAGGIGAAVCARLAALGHTVVVADLDLEAAERVAKEVGGTAVRTDVSDPADNHAMVAHAVAAHGGLDVLVLGAGIQSDVPPDPGLDVARYRRALGVNLDGVVFGVDAATPALRDSGGQVVVNASLAALGPELANPVYALTKAAAVAYVRAMSTPLARAGVRINAICPGFTDTPFLGITARLMRKQKFPLLSPDEVALAVETVVTGDGTGEAWALVAGRPAAPYRFPDVPTTMLPDGTEVVLKPFLSAKQ